MKRGYRGIVPYVTRQDVPAGKDWRGTLHHHLFSLTLRGGADYVFPDNRVTIQAGDLLHFDPGAWQNWVADASHGWTVYYLIIDVPARLRDLLPPSNLAAGVGRVHLDGMDLDEVQNAFARMDTWGDSTRLMESLLLNQLEYVLLLIRGRHPISKLDDRIEKAREFLLGRLETPTTLADVARAACLSKARLCGLFRDAMDMSPLRYLEHLRMERAAQLLLFTALDIDTIAGILCYDERKYFDKRFKRHWQATPFRYRKQEKSSFDQS